MLLRSGIDTRSEKTEIPERMLVVLRGFLFVFFFFFFLSFKDLVIGEWERRMREWRQFIYVDNSKKRISIMGKAERG